MIDEWTAVVGTGLHWISIAAWKALPLFALALALDVLLRRRIPARYHCLLWMVVIARLLLPVSVSSPISMANTVDQTVASARGFAAHLRGVDRPSDSRGRVTGDDTDLRRWRSAASATTAMRITNDSLAHDGQSNTGKLSPDWHRIAANVTIWTWFIIALGMIIRGSVSYCRFALQLRNCPSIQDQGVIDTAHRICDSLGVSRRPPIKQVQMISAPAIFGIWRPVLCLPVDWKERLTDEELTWVLRHELAHVKRRDAMVLCIANVVRALHWFHPLSWMALSKLQCYVEHAADDVVTRSIRPTSVADYGRLLLRYAECNSSSDRPEVVGLMAMASHRGLRRRVESLRADFRGSSWRMRIIMTSLLLGVVATGLTDAQVVKPAYPVRNTDAYIQDTLDRADIGPRSAVEAKPEAGQVEFDVHAAIKKAREMQPGINAERFLIHYLAWDDAGGAEIRDGILHATLSSDQERRCRAMLDAFVRSGPWQLAIECCIVTSDMALVREFDWSSGQVEAFRGSPQWRSSDTEAERDPSRAVFEDEPNFGRSLGSTGQRRPALATKAGKQVSEQFIKRCNSHPRYDVLHAPKLTLFNGQSVTVSDVVRRPFVTNVEIVRGDFAHALQPVIDVVDDGWTIRLKAEATEDGTVELDCSLTESTIGDVQLANLPLRSSSDPEEDVVVQVPNVRASSIHVSSTLAPDETMCIASPKPYSADTDESRNMATIFMINTTLIPGTEDLDTFTPVTPNL